MSSTRIAQLSDLHCDGSQAWKANFKAVREVLVKAKPSLVLITGDCADHPKRSFYRMLKAELDALTADLKPTTEGSVPILAIAGNHDYSFWGNYLWGQVRSAAFYSELGDFTYGNGVSKLPSALPAKLIETAVTHRVAIFPFDSNRTRIGRIYFARGRVDEPEAGFRKLADEYKACLQGRNVAWDDCIKIAILHHHPLPLPDSVSGELLEGFHLLDNAHEFLRAASEIGVHLILHGHKHVSGTAEFRYGTGDSQTHTVCVSACNTSTKVNHPHREICLFDVLPSGSVAMRRVRPDSSSQFVFNESDPSVEVIRYSYRRKVRADTERLWPELATSQIHRIGTKSKVVRIVDSGTAWVKITLDDLIWKPNPDPSKDVLREFLHGGVGRILAASWLYRNGAGHPQGDVQLWPRPQLGPGCSAEFERLWFPIKPPNPSVDAPSRFELKYILQNGYCVTAEEYAESFPQAKAQEETSTMEVLVPTEQAELIITFPWGQMPDEDDVRLDAWILPNGLPSQDIHIARRNYALDEDEVQFLIDKGAIRYRPELSQVAAVIRHPQPGVAYTLRWRLSRPAGDQGYSDDELEGLDSLRHRIETLTIAQHNAIEQAVRVGLNRVDIHIALAVYDGRPAQSDVAQLRIVQPAMLRGAAAFVGRGIIGQAFQTRRPQHHSRSRLTRASPPGRESLSLFGAASDDVFLVEGVLCEPLTGPISELLALPLIPRAGVSDMHGTANGSRRPPVAGVLIILRNDGQRAGRDFFAFDLDSPAGRHSAREMVQPLVGIVDKVLER